MFEVLRKRRVATPDARFVSRFADDKTEALKRIRRQWPGKDLYIQPDRGTEATGCVFIGGDQPTLEQWRECGVDRDLIVRQKAGNLSYGGHNFVLRINVTCDGEAFSADSGYGMVGGQIVCAARGALKENLNELFGQLGLRHDEVDRIKTTACAALEAVSEDSVPPRLAGVDLVLEKRGALTAYVIDINPRPVVVGSRLIGSDAIGLGDHFWRGIRDLQMARMNCTTEPCHPGQHPDPATPRSAPPSPATPDQPYHPTPRLHIPN